MDRRTLLAGALSTLAATRARPSGAQTVQHWPARPVRLILSVSPGQANDIVARMMADKVSRNLGQQMFVENIPAASGLVGAQTAARAAPDGYTFFFGPASVMSANMYLLKSLPYDPNRDFTPVAMVCDTGPFVIAANAELPVKTLAELIAYAKANPGRLTYAVVTSGAFGPLIGQWLIKRTGIEMVQIPYGANAQALQDTVAGTTQLMITASATVDALVRAGKLTRLAITSSRRFPSQPDIPTFSETLPGFVIDGWFSVVAPAGTPTDIILRLNREIDAFLKDADVLARFATMGVGTSGAGTPQSTGEFIRAEQAKWRKIVDELGIVPQ